MFRQSNKQKEVIMFQKRKSNIDESQLSHTKYDCQYHIVFIPKFRRKAIYGKLRRDIGVILRRLCEYKGVEIVEANACIDHIHMLVKIPPKISVSQFMEYLKGKSCLMIFENCRVTIDVTPCKYKKSKKSDKILIEQKNIYRKDFLL